MTIKRSKSSGDNLPVIPEKRYFTIGEVSQLCSVKPHVLRYWEQEFPVLRPSKRKGSRRYYQLKDVMMVRQIRELLYDQEFTISGARQQLKVMKAELTGSSVEDKTVFLSEVSEGSLKTDESVVSSSSPSIEQRLPIAALRKDLEVLLSSLRE